jgi:hypothetical protein
MTPLNATLIKVFAVIKRKDFVQNPSSMVSPPHTRTSKKFFLFHRDKKHDIKGCFTL